MALANPIDGQIWLHQAILLLKKFDNPFNCFLLRTWIRVMFAYRINKFHSGGIFRNICL